MCLTALCILIGKSGKRLSEMEESEMALFDDEPIKKKPVHEIGQDLSLLSVGELNERIAALRAEIRRLEAELTVKGSTKSAAEALFKRG
ncbi:hypothetical protein AA2016_1478 [Aminobacter aminovorans]|jgi:uncharacterized small protein (DUF1192 family)|uniref:DUF1192 domain-containing protein n=2 Tax=Aminobacter aminovorans TaxID=83263 RepID=A0AAC9AQF1_AMIAI|nr:hypothetical protein AA2016_1478 [Aminobacter aminovorans]